MQEVVMASLRVRHQRSCALTVEKLEQVRRERGDAAARRAGVKETTAPERGRVPGCTCTPTYAIKSGAGASYEKVGRVLRDARRQREKVSEQVEEGSYVAPKNMTFAEWAEAWRIGLARPKAGTVAGYKSSVDYGVRAFGEKRVRSVTVEDIDELVRVMAAERTPGGKVKCSPSTQAKHLRVLSACFDAAIRRRLAAVNPIAQYDNKPKGARAESAFFEDGELAPLFRAFVQDGFERTYYAMALTALMTGARHGELAALTFGDLDMTNAEMRIRRAVRQSRLSETKNRERRTVDLTGDAVKLLGQWWSERGKPGDDALVFPDEDGGFLDDGRALHRLKRAMKAAGIDRAGPTGEDRDWHSLRHTYARVSLERGVPLYALSKQLGHSSVAVTDSHYGHWAREASKREAKKLEGAFAV
jgi:integrase